MFLPCTILLVFVLTSINNPHVVTSGCQGDQHVPEEVSRLMIIYHYERDVDGKHHLVQVRLIAQGPTFSLQPAQVVGYGRRADLDRRG